MLEALPYGCGYTIVKQEENDMYATYHLRADEINDDIVQEIKSTYRHDEIVILPKNAYTEFEKISYNTAFTEKLQQSIQDIKEGRGIVKTMVELEAMENE
jgi:nicotinamidase-related amidase